MIGLVGRVSSGKSSIINSILGEFREEVSLRKCTTEIRRHKSDLGILIEFPGVDSETPSELILDNIHSLDILCYVTEVERAFTSTAEVKFFKSLAELVIANNSKGLGPYYILVIVNKYDTPSDELYGIYSSVYDTISTILLDNIKYSVMRYSAHQAFMELVSEEYRNCISYMPRKIRDEFRRIKKNAGSDTEFGTLTIRRQFACINVDAEKDLTIFKCIMKHVQSSHNTCIDTPLRSHRYKNLGETVKAYGSINFTIIFKWYLLQYYTDNQYIVDYRSMDKENRRMFLIYALGYYITPPLKISPSSGDRLLMARTHLPEVLLYAKDRELIYYTIYHILKEGQGCYLSSIGFDIKKIIHVYGMPLYLQTAAKTLPLHSHIDLDKVEDGYSICSGTSIENCITGSSYVLRMFPIIEQEFALTRDEILEDSVARAFVWSKLF